VRQPERPDTRGVDHPPTEVQRQRNGLGRRVPTLADIGHLADRPIRFRHKAIHQCRLTDPRVAEQHGDLIRQQRGDGVERVVAPGGGDREVEVGELGGKRFRRGQVGLGETQDGLESTRIAGDQRALN
jgi:hypothetical protein